MLWLPLLLPCPSSFKFWIFFHNPAPYSLGDELGLIHLIPKPNALTSGLSGSRPLELLGICTFVTSSPCLPVVCVCVWGGGGRGLQLVQSLWMKPQVITCSFSWDLFTSSGSKHLFLIYLKCHLHVIAPGTPGNLCICDLPVLSPGWVGDSWFRVFRWSLKS